MTSEPPPLRVAILLAVYNGAEQLRAQLDSYAGQTVPPVLVLASDDGSQDASREILNAFAAEHPELNVQIVEGPRRGAAHNFLSLLRDVPRDIDVVALSDQDDVWLPDKLHRGLRALKQQAGQPVLYCGRTWECDADLGNRRISKLRSETPCFRHALVQNIAGGNTMMLNRAAIELTGQASREAKKVVVHDWWIYQLITGVGGLVIYDPAPLLFYRQHSRNMIGANRGLLAKIRRFKHLLSGRLRRWNTVNIRALSASEHRLTPENQTLLRLFGTGRNGSMRERIRMLRHTRVFRQGLEGRLSLYAAALLRRL